MFKDSLFIALLEWEKMGKKGTFEDGKKNPKTLRFSGGGVVNFFGGLINIHIYRGTRKRGLFYLCTYKYLREYFCALGGSDLYPSSRFVCV